MATMSGKRTLEIIVVSGLPPPCTASVNLAMKSELGTFSLLTVTFGYFVVEGFGDFVQTVHLALAGEGVPVADGARQRAPAGGRRPGALRRGGWPASRLTPRRAAPPPAARTPRASSPLPVIAEAVRNRVGAYCMGSSRL